jgi:glycosyltransferase involved in cell wall biosynthesis
MKILRITSLGYVGGGVENGIELLQPVLERMGHEVRILSSDHNKAVPHFSHYEFRSLETQPMILKVFYRIFYPHSFFALRRALKDFKPDVVQIHSLFEVSPSVLFLLKKYPSVLTIHGGEDFTAGLLLWVFPLRFFRNTESLTLINLNIVGWLHYLYHRLLSIPVYRLAFRNIDRFVVFSTYMQELVKRDGITATCIPNATELFEPVPLAENSRTLLYVGRLEKIKGVQYAIEAMRDIAPSYPDARLVIAGRGEYEQELRELVARQGLSEYVTFVGHCTREQLYGYYKEARCVVVPSVWPEPFGKVGIEALSVGRPVIASNVGGISEWLRDGETGYLVPRQNAAAIRDAVQKLFDDRALLERMSAQAREQAQQFSIENHAKKILALYTEVLEGKD